jgi:WD40 repeat protein
VVWNLRGERLATLRGHEADVNTASFSADDRRIVSASHDATARVWDAASGRELGRVSGEGDMSAGFDATGTRILTTTNQTARLWDIATWSLVRTFEATSYVRFAAINAAGTLVAATGNDNSVSVWDVATSSLLAQFQHADVPWGVAFSPDGDLAITSATDLHAIVWHVELEHRPPAVVAAFVRCHAPYRLVETRLETATPVCRE